MKQPKYIIKDIYEGDYYEAPGMDYTGDFDNAFRYTNEQLIKYFELWEDWLPEETKIIQVYGD